MEITMTTPALLFPAISLLLLAYNNRYVAFASLIRRLHGERQTNPDDSIPRQIDNLYHRLKLIRWMQIIGVTSIFICTICICVLYFGWVKLGKILFGVSLVLMVISLALCLWEIQLAGSTLAILLGERKTKS